MYRKSLILILFLIQSIALSQWSDPAYSKINRTDQEDERYKLMDKMSINLKNSDIRNVLTMIGELTGLNIVISPNIEDTITANLLTTIDELASANDPRFRNDLVIGAPTEYFRVLLT